MNNKELFNLFLRYAVLMLIGLFGINLIYFIFTPIIIYPAFWILKLFYADIVLESKTLLLNSQSINIIPACIAGSAYYLLLVLNLATQMRIKTRIKSIIFLFLSFSALNIIRLSVFAALFFASCSYFDLAHKAVWYFGSTLFVVALWFVNVYLFKIKAIPVYTDFKNLSSNLIIQKRKKKK